MPLPPGAQVVTVPTDPPRARDEVRLGRIAMVTDRGVQHARNEDAGAAGELPADGGRPPVLAVVLSDGVSSSINPQTASAAAVAAGLRAILHTMAHSADPAEAMSAGLDAAAHAAAEPDPHSGAAGSCTFTAAILVGGQDGTAQITVGNVGDSRSYWLPDPPGAPRVLTIDDSLAQELIAAGASPGSEAVLRGAHTLTRWLGADSEPAVWEGAAVTSIEVTEPGVLLLCTDGLWNYVPEAWAIRELCQRDIAATACSLADYALAAGGADNITVAVLAVGDHPVD